MIAAPLAILFAALGTPADWASLSFKNIPPVRHDIGAGRITLHVDRSAGGIVRNLPAGTRISKLTVRGRIEGTLDTREDALWRKGNDDALLRIGLVHAGGKPLNGFQRAAAPAWIRTLDDVLCADGRGPSRIDSFLVVAHTGWIGKTRQHPGMKQVHERIVASPDRAGNFTVAVAFPEPVDALGLWLMADGDDTGSKFSVFLESIELGGS